MDNFVAIDVETANGEPTSICSIGAVKVIDGHITESFYELVRPEPNYYYRYFTEKIHGLSRRDTDTADIFPQVWERVSKFIGGMPLVAHNKRFDENCIRRTFRCYGMDYPEYPFYCTLVAARRAIPRQMCGSHSLPSLCSFMGIPFDNHHNALADAVACAKLAINLL